MLKFQTIPQDLGGADRRYRTLLEQGVAVALINTDGNIVYESPLAVRQFAYSVESMIGKGVLDTVHADDQPQVAALMAQLIREPSVPVTVEVRTLSQETAMHWIEATGVNFLTDPDIEALAVYYRDITDNKEAEQRLHLLATALEATASGIVITDPTGIIEWVNPAFTRLTGYLQAEVLGRPTSFLKSGVHAPGLYRELWETILRGDVWAGELVNRHKDGTHYTEEMTITPVRDAENRIAHFVAVKQNISERRRSELALQESEHRYRTLFENSSISLWEEDFSQVKVYIEALRQDGVTDFRAHFISHPEAVRQCADMVRIVDVNRATLDLVGVESKAQLLAGLRNFFTPESYEVFREQVVALAEGKTHFESETQHLTQTGQLSWVQLRLARLSDDWSKVSVSLADVSARRRAEQESEAARLLAQNTVDSLSAHIAIVDEQGTIVATNDAWQEFARVSGADPDSVGVGANYFEVTQVAGITHDAQVAADFTAGLHTVLCGERDFFSLEYACHSPTEERWFEGRITPFKGNGIARAVIAHEDITKRVQAEHALQIKNRNLTILNRIGAFSTAANSMEEVLANICGEIQTYWSVPHVTALFIDEDGETATVVAEQKLDELPSLLGETLSPKEYCLVERSNSLNGPLLYTLDSQERAPFKDWPALAWAKSEVCVLLHVQGTVRGAICCHRREPHPFSEQDLHTLASIARPSSLAFENSLLYRQISQYNDHLSVQVAQRTAQLQHLNERLTAILDAANDTILLVDEAGRIESGNPAFSAQFGYSSNGVSGLPLTAIADPESLNALESALDSVQSVHEPVRLQISACRQDGSLFDAEIALAHVPNNHSHTVCMIHDISHLKAVERMKDQFISNVNHELRNPIAGIVLSAGGLHAYYDRLSEEQKLQRISQIQVQAKILTDLTDAILDMARVESRQGRPGDDTVDLCTIAQDVVSELHPQAAAQRQQIDLACAVSSMPTTGDAMDFARIWRNLIGNAIKYSPEGATVSVQLDEFEQSTDGPRHLPKRLQHDTPPSLSALPPGVYAIAQVVDNGHGMEANDLAKLFTRFHRGWAQHSNIPGTGLGLVLVRDILHLYGGDIAVQSTVGIGTTITFWIPLKVKGSET